MSKQIQFQLDKLEDVLSVLMEDGNVTYHMAGMEGKVSNLAGTEPSEISQLDCSGFTQYVIYKTTFTNVEIKPGSWWQEHWCKNENFEKVDYAEHAKKLDGVVRIAFRHSDNDAVATDVRHVWLIINRWTVECTTRGTANGPTSFPWGDRTDQADTCFTLGPIQATGPTGPSGLITPPFAWTPPAAR